MRKNSIILVFLLLIFLLKISSVDALGDYKGFTRNVGEERIFSGVILNDGSFVIAGGYGTWARPELSGEGDGNFASIIARYTISGEMIWEKTLDTTNDNPINDIKVAKNGDLILAGTYFLARLDKDGEIIWYDRYEQWNDDYYFDSLVLDQDDNIYVDTTKKLIKYDKDRNVVKEYPHDKIYEEDMVYSKEKDEIVLLHRHIVDSNFDTEILVTGLDTDLNKKWEYRLTPPNNDGRYLVSSITEANDGYIIVGYVSDDITIDGIDKKGEKDAFILKIDKEGNKLWVNTYGGVDKRVYYAIGGQVDNGNIIVFGDTEYYEGRTKLSDEINIFEYSNKTGELVSVKTHLHSEQFSGSGISNISCAYGGVISNENGYVFTGFTAFDEFDGLKPSENPDFERYHYNSFVIYNTQPSVYDITKKEKYGGSIDLSSSNSIAGEVITIIVNPDDGYWFDNLTILDNDNNVVEYSKTSDNTYTFVMPDSDVFIEAYFLEEIKNPETGDIILISIMVLLLFVLCIICIRKKFNIFINY